MRDKRTRRRAGRPVVVFVLLAILAAMALWLVPQLQVAPAWQRLQSEQDLTSAERLALEAGLFQAENAARMTLTLIFAAAGLLLGLGVAWRRYEISRELKTYERFTQAVEQLGSERGDGSARTETRLGGIYALERLLLASDREYWPIIEVLTAYLRGNAAWRPTGLATAPNSGPFSPPADIQAILAVIGRRREEPHGDRRLLDMRETDLRGANLSGTRLEAVTLAGAHLEKVDATRVSLARSNLREAVLSGATLSEADLQGASLARVNLEGARLNGAKLKGADLSGANLRGADLWETDLSGANLKDADLRGADLSQAVLDGAILWRADLQGAVLTGTHLKETHLERANLAGATGLTWEQGKDAYTDENTVLPAYLVPGSESARLQAAAVTVAEPRRPTPAARRAPPRANAPAPAEMVARDNVVQLKPSQPPPAKSAASKQAAPPKKAAVPKRRKPGLVEPA